LAGCADVRGTVRVEQATAGKLYDFVVHVKKQRRNWLQSRGLK
jgi:hypothetical protein